MKQHNDSKGELRAAFTLREIEKAQQSVPTGTLGVFMRVTLAILFLFLIMVSYEILGITGPVFVSVLFLVSFFVPLAYQAVKNRLEQRQARAEEQRIDEDSPVRQEV